MISFKLPVPVNFSEIQLWLIQNNAINDCTYHWPSAIITFQSHENATAFQLRFNVLRYTTTLEEKLQKEING
jgi:hypothetical protein